MSFQRNMEVWKSDDAGKKICNQRTGRARETEESLYSVIIRA